MKSLLFCMLNLICKEGVDEKLCRTSKLLGGVGWLRIKLIIRLSQPQAWDWAWAELGDNVNEQHAPTEVDN